MSKNRTAHASAHSRALHEYAAKHGWTVSVNNASHLVLEKPGCRAVRSSLTPSCLYATRKAIADLKRSERAANDNQPPEGERMKGPSHVECAKVEGIERRNFVSTPSGFNCPFCNKRTSHSALKKATGHRCTCGALYSTQQTIAQHYKRKGN